MMSPLNMTLEQFHERYDIVCKQDWGHSISTNELGDIDTYLFDLNSKPADYPEESSTCHIWTLCEEGKSQYLNYGKTFVNRIGYVFTTFPPTFTVPLI